MADAGAPDEEEELDGTVELMPMFVDVEDALLAERLLLLILSVGTDSSWIHGRTAEGCSSSLPASEALYIFTIEVRCYDSIVERYLSLISSRDLFGILAPETSFPTLPILFCCDQSVQL